MEGEERKIPPRGPRINAQFSDMPATECIGAGRLDGWFSTPAFLAESRGFGHIQSMCFEGELFFHLQRSPWLRGINFQKRDEVTFEVIEFNGKIEAVKLLLPTQVQELEEKSKGPGDEAALLNLVGQRVTGFMKSHHLLVEKQNWGFVGSDSFPGQVFWHVSENPDMEGVDFDRGDVVEFEIVRDDARAGADARGGQVRARYMRFISRPEQPLIKAPELSESKRRKKEQWLKNWSSTPPPDWVCKFCGWQNFGRNKTCNFNNKNAQNCPGVRPPREEWPDTGHVKASDVDGADVIAQKALHQRWQAHLQYGKEEEVPQGWHASSRSSDPAPQAVEKPTSPIPVPVLGKEDMPLMLEAGMPGAIAAVQLQSRHAVEKGELPDAWTPRVVPVPPPRPTPYGGGAAGAYVDQGYGHQDGSYGYGKAAGKGKKGKSEAQVTASLPNDDVEAVMAASLQAFTELQEMQDLPTAKQDAQVALLIAEVNQTLGADRSAKHALSMQLARHPFLADQFEVRYQPGKNQIVVARPGATFTPQVVLPPDATQQRMLSIKG